MYLCANLLASLVVDVNTTTEAPNPSVMEGEAPGARDCMVHMVRRVCTKDFRTFPTSPPLLLMRRQHSAENSC